MGMGFDTYQLFRGIGKFPRWLVFVLDICFWIASVILTFYVLLRVNNGIVRFPIFIGLIIGAWSYFVIGSKAYTQFLKRVIKFSVQLYRTFLKILELLVWRPILAGYRLIVILLTFLLTIVLAIGRFLWRIILFLSTPFVSLSRITGKGLRRAKAGIWLRLQKWFKPKKRD